MPVPSQHFLGRIGNTVHGTGCALHLPSYKSLVFKKRSIQKVDTLWVKTLILSNILKNTLNSNGEEFFKGAFFFFSSSTDETNVADDIYFYWHQYHGAHSSLTLP